MMTTTETTSTNDTGLEGSADVLATSCFESRTTWEPLHMPGVALPIVEPDSPACQQRCAATPGCAHFSFWEFGKHCYLQNSWAIRQTARLGFVSGPFQCWDDLAHNGKFVRVGQTYLPKALKCVELGTLYTPIMGVPMQLTNVPGTGEDAAKMCMRQCARTKGCAHWTMQFPQRLCRLSGANAHAVHPYINAVSGPPRCQHPQHSVLASEILMKDEEDPGADTQRSRIFLVFVSAPVVLLVTCTMAALTYMFGGAALRVVHGTQSSIRYAIVHSGGVRAPWRWRSKPLLPEVEERPQRRHGGSEE